MKEWEPCFKVKWFSDKKKGSCRPQFVRVIMDQVRLRGKRAYHEKKKSGSR